MGGIRGGFSEGVLFELSHVDMHTISTIEEREEVLRRKVVS